MKRVLPSPARELWREHGGVLLEHLGRLTAGAAGRRPGGSAGGRCSPHGGYETTPAFGVDEGRFVVPDDFDEPFDDQLLRGFEGRD